MGINNYHIHKSDYIRLLRDLGHANAVDMNKLISYLWCDEKPIEDVTDVILEILFNYFYYINPLYEYGENAYLLEVDSYNGKIAYEQHGWEQCYLISEEIEQLLNDFSHNDEGDVLCMSLQAALAMLLESVLSPLFRDGKNYILFHYTYHKEYIIFSNVHRLNQHPEY